MRLSVHYKIRDGAPSGTTMVKLHVDKNGQTRNVALLESSGKPNLDEAVINSAWGGTFQPYLVNGEPTEVTVVVPFHLK
ncbi:hypothetical protein UC35_22570 [Ramlibacter tataouinensis]|uniref:TonB C-terminal domain-containing protein n=2 Tax=Ramlibacter tataouinensis TaxID=94132 RepID=A0A127JZ43_9BURK|nr:hypothetical protein UC35_22570 [Ramlibacter tataouinensis]